MVLQAVLQLHLHVRLPQLESCLKSHQMENVRQLRDGIIPLHLKKKPEKNGLYAKSINGVQFSLEVKEQVVEMIKEDLGQVDMVIYSLAAPRRTTADGTVWASSLKTTGRSIYRKKSGFKK